MIRNFFRNLKSGIKNYLTFTQSEKRGTIILLILIFLYCIAMIIYNFLPQGSTDFSEFDKEIETLEKSASRNDSVISNPLPSVHAKDSIVENRIAPKPIRYFKFDPNHLADSLWMELGLSEKQIHVIKNYEAKGGHFYKKEDVKKMYCVTPALYTGLEPYITIEENSQKLISHNYRKDSVNVKSDKKEVSIKRIDLNIATEEQLEALPGIGKVIATNIIKYKNYLGGYYKKEQLLEVWHFSDSLFQATEKYFIVNQIYVQQKNVNTDQLKELRHPYLDWDGINKIKVYRKQFGNIDSMEKLKKVLNIDDAAFEKLKPYIKFSD